jgi:addiction module HigA family antidote
MLQVAQRRGRTDGRSNRRLSLRKPKTASRSGRPAIHPGTILGDELTELGVTPTALARELGVPANRITQIVRGRRSISGDTALRLAHWLGTTPQFWLNLQMAYELRLAEQKSGQDIRRLPSRVAAE